MKTHKTHKHDYYEYRGSPKTHKRQVVRGKGGFVFCRNDPNCMHILEPDAMALFRKIVRQGKTPIIRAYPRTAKNGRQLVSIYPNPKKSHAKTK